MKLGLRESQRIKFRYLLRAAGVGGANDASTAIAEAIDGTESFAVRMNGYSAELGLSKASWSNAHGLTQKGNIVTARDIAVCLLHISETFQLTLIYSAVRKPMRDYDMKIVL